MAIGFNRGLAWTHTVTRAHHFNLFRLTLDPRDPSGTSYMFNGRSEKMRARTVTVERLRADGALDRITKTFHFSRQGAILVKPDANLTWGANTAYALGDPNRYNTRMFEQWMGLGTAATVGDLKQSLDRVVGLPWVNTMAADRNGDTLYADAGVVPNVSKEQARGPCLLNPKLLMLDGSTSACAWKNDPGAPAGIVSPLRSPSLLRQDYVGQLQRYLLDDESPCAAGRPGCARVFLDVRRSPGRAVDAHQARRRPAGAGDRSEEDPRPRVISKTSCSPTASTPPN